MCKFNVMAGVDLLLLVRGETKQIYSFATPKFQRLISSEIGKLLMQNVLNEVINQPSICSLEKVLEFDHV